MSYNNHSAPPGFTTHSDHNKQLSTGYTQAPSMPCLLKLSPPIKETSQPTVSNWPH